MANFCGNPDCTSLTRWVVKRRGAWCQSCVAEQKRCQTCRTGFMSIAQRQHHTANAVRLCKGA